MVGGAAKIKSVTLYAKSPKVIPRIGMAEGVLTATPTPTNTMSKYLTQTAVDLEMAVVGTGLIISLRGYVPELCKLVSTYLHQLPMRTGARNRQIDYIKLSQATEWSGCDHYDAMLVVEIDNPTDSKPIVVDCSSREEATLLMEDVATAIEVINERIAIEIVKLREKADSVAGFLPATYDGPGRLHFTS